MHHDIEISTDKKRLDVGLIHHYLTKTAYWSKGRTMETVIRTIANSMVFGIYKKKKQIGFARVISDYATYYYLCDVFIIPEEAGNGYGKQLTRFIVNHPDLTGCRGSLMTSDAHGLYEQFGFKNDPEIMTKYMTRASDAVNMPSNEND